MGLSHPAGFVFFLSLFRVLSSVWIARDMRSQSVMQKPRHRKVSGFCVTAAVPGARRPSKCAAVAAVLRPGSREDQRALKALTLANSLASLRSAGV